MNTPIIPPYLKAGDTIGITAPAGYVSKERTTFAIKTLQDWGYKVVLGKTIGTQHHYFSGNDEARHKDLQHMLDDNSIDAILMGRGGYGMSRIIDDLDFTAFQKKPKWICGFSDITVLHQHINRQLGTAVMHAPMCGAFTQNNAKAKHLLSFKKALSGEAISMHLKKHSYNKHGKGSGQLVGGNLAIMAHLTGSHSAVETAGNILFLEDVGEYLYNIDRMLYNLKRAGRFDNLAGVVIGDFTDNQDTELPFGKTWQRIVKDIFAEYDYPIAYGLPCGHGAINYALKLGVPYTLEVGVHGATLKEH